MSALPIIEQNSGAGDDLTNDRKLTENRFLYANPGISTATTTLVKSGGGVLREIIVLGGTIGAVTVYDSLTATGNVIVPTVTPIQGGVLIRDVEFYTGLTIVTAAATVLAVSYR